MRPTIIAAGFRAISARRLHSGRTRTRRRTPTVLPIPAGRRSTRRLAETRALVEAALEKLNPKFRAAVVLRDIEDLSYDEIATVLEVSLGTVKSRILRGREALRRILEGRLEPEASVQWAAQPLAE